MTQFIIRNGQIMQRAVSFIQGLPSHKNWSVVIKEDKKDLTGQQRRFLHQCIQIISGHTGDEPEDVKLRLKFATLPLREVYVAGKTYMFPVSTESLTREQYSKLIEAVLMLGASLGLVMPVAKNQGLEI